jgi:hypothetical protein
MEPGLGRKSKKYRRENPGAKNTEAGNLSATGLAP